MEKDYYQLGIQAFNQTPANSYCNNHLKDIGIDWDNEWANVSPYDRSRFSDGFRDAKKAYLKPFFKPVWEELKQFERANNFKIYTGCGCCGAGYCLTVYGIDYEVYEEYLDD